MGYPFRSAIFCACGRYGALRPKRPNKAKKAHSETVEIILSEIREYFDPDVVDAFLGIVEKFDDISNAYLNTL